MALQDFARQVVFFDGRQVKIVESFNFETDSGEQPVVVLNEGLGGFTPGGGQCTLSGTMFVPVGGFEEPVQSWCANGLYCTVQYGLGPVAYVGEGKFTKVTIAGGVNDAVKVDFTWIGEKKAME